MSKITHSGKALAARLTTSGLALLTAGMVTLTTVSFQNSSIANNLLHTSDTKLITDGEGEIISYDVDMNETQLNEFAKQVSISFGEEGSVLLKNDNKALPLKNGAKVSVFGYAENTSNSSSDYNAYNNLEDFKKLLAEKGVAVNPDLYDFYNVKEGRDFPNRTKAWSEVSGTVSSKIGSYTDVGIYNFFMSNRETANSAISSLGLSQVARDTLKAMKQDLGIKKTVLIANVTNVFDADVFAEKITVNGREENLIDAVVITSTLGSYGLTGLVNALTGTADFTGRAQDTWAMSSKSSAAYQNAVSVSVNAETYANDPFVFSNYADVEAIIGDKYTQNGAYSRYSVWKEGIYVDYKYYETRYEDSVLNASGTKATGNYGVSAPGATAWDYDKEVYVPFGGGLSYNEYTATMGRPSYNIETDSYDVPVTVKNNGSIDGKYAVQLYFQSPYTDYDKQYNVEKSAVNLGGFEKVDVAAGETKNVTVSVPRRLMASYDYTNAKTYIFEEGDYYFAIGDGAHDAVNNILKAKGASVSGNAENAYKLELNASNAYATSEKGVEITNRLTEVTDLNALGYHVTYLTRKDWSTFPEAPTQTTRLEANKIILDRLKEDYGGFEKQYGATYEEQNAYWVAHSEADKIKAEYGENYVKGVDNGLTLAMMRGLEYDDQLWEKLIDQVSVEEMLKVNFQVQSGNIMDIQSVSKPEVMCCDGVQGWTQFPVVLESGKNFEVTVGSGWLQGMTWSKELKVKQAKMMGAASLLDKNEVRRVGWWGTTANIHRHPYNSRNGEYPSADGNFTGIYTNLFENELMKYGVQPYIKHFALYENEGQRQGLNVFCNEQDARENSLRPFELCWTDNRFGSYTMTSYNALGGTWTAICDELINDILKGEWGFKGILRTDNVPVRGLTNYVKMTTIGNGIHMAFILNQDYTADWAVHNYDYYTGLRETMHGILYASANDGTLLGFTSTMKVVPNTPWWKPTFIALTVVAGMGFVASAAWLVMSDKKNQEEN